MTADVPPQTPGEPANLAADRMPWRPMRLGDLDGVVAVARRSFPDHFESRDCFAERLMLYPRGCFVLDDADRGVAGYLIAYPWIVGTAPPLNSLIGGLPANPELIYLHDLALHPQVRGSGQTRTIIERLAQQAQDDGWDRIALVAVNMAADFWRRAGFKAVDDPLMKAKLESYGHDAAYMVRRL